MFVFLHSTINHIIDLAPLTANLTSQESWMPFSHITNSNKLKSSLKPAVLTKCNHCLPLLSSLI